MIIYLKSEALSVHNIILFPLCAPMNIIHTLIYTYTYMCIRYENVFLILIKINNIFISTSKTKKQLNSNIKLYYLLHCRTVLISVGYLNIPLQSLELVASSTRLTSLRDNAYILVQSKSVWPNTQLCRSHKINGQATAYTI